jgi:hypothetical protein
MCVSGTGSRVQRRGALLVHPSLRYKTQFCIAASSPSTLMCEYQEGPRAHVEFVERFITADRTLVSLKLHLLLWAHIYLICHLLKLVGSDIIALLHNRKPCCNAPLRSRSKIKAPNPVSPLNLKSPLLYAHIQIYTN